jgi:hypothetical protein
MDVKKTIVFMLSGNCYQVGGMQLTGCRDRALFPQLRLSGWLWLQLLQAGIFAVTDRSCRITPVCCM